MLATIDSNKFNYKNKIGKFKYLDIKDLVNNIKNNAISEIHAKKDLNTLNEIKNGEIRKDKRHTPKQIELLNLFNDLLDTILTDKTIKSKSQKGNTSMLSKGDDDNENDKTLMSSTDNDHNEHDKTLMSSTDDDDDETVNQNNNNIIKQMIL